MSNASVYVIRCVAKFLELKPNIYTDACPDITYPSTQRLLMYSNEFSTFYFRDEVRARRQLETANRDLSEVVCRAIKYYLMYED